MPEVVSSKSTPWTTSPGVNSGEKTLSETTTGLAAGTPVTVSLKTLTFSAAAFEAAMVASATATATAANEQDFACSRFLTVSFKVICVGLFFWVCAAIDRTPKHLLADCDE